MNYGSAQGGGVEASDILAVNELEDADLLRTGDDDFAFDLASKSALLFMASESSSSSSHAAGNSNQDSTLTSTGNSPNNKLITGTG